MITVGKVIPKGNWEMFLTLPNERLLLVKRKHWFNLFQSLFALGLLAAILFIVEYVFFLIVLSSLTLFISGSSLILLFCTLLAIKVFTDWYFYLYIVTSRKLLEVKYDPLSSYTVNDILLDQVKCTEVDVRTEGIINKLIDRGDIVLTFDRPTHGEEFVFADIKGARNTSSVLGRELIMREKQNTPENESWYRQKNLPGKYRYTEDVFLGAGV